MYHELTTKLTTVSSDWEERDKVIRKWLSEKAKDIKENFKECEFSGHPRVDRKVEQLLGLSEPEPKQQTQEKWCRHIYWGTNFYGKKGWCLEGDMQFSDQIDWKFCPVCSAPRPVKKSLAEKFEKILWQKQVKYTDYGLGPQQPLQFQLAEIAQQHFGVKDE